MPSYGPVQWIPGGLLSALGLKNAGRNPDTIGSELNPTLELNEFYFNSNAEIFQRATRTGLPTNTRGYFAFTGTVFTVPDNEIWYVTHFSLRTVAALAAGDRISFTPALRAQSAGTNIVVSVGEEYTTPGGLTVDNTPIAGSLTPFWAPPTTDLGANINFSVLAAGTFDLSGHLHAFKMRI